jgi:hypothetical protein
LGAGCFVKEHLDELGLEFLKFYMKKTFLEKYLEKNAIDPEGKNLEVWDKWEQENSEIFIGMYRFWCQKAG